MAFAGLAYGFSFDPALPLKMAVHASGGVSSVNVCGATSQLPPATTPSTGTPTGGFVPNTAPSGIQQGGTVGGLPAVSGYSVIPGASGGAQGTAPAAGGGAGFTNQRWSETPGGRRSASGFEEREPAYQSAEITPADGGVIPARRVFSGLNNKLRLRTGNGVMHIWFGDIASIKFGEKELSRLHVTVTFNDGSEMEGTIYPGTVFEFEEAGKSAARRAEDLAEVAFISD